MNIISYLKYYHLKRGLKKRIKGLTLGKRVVIEYPERLISKGYLYIEPGAFWSLKGGVEIGENVIFGPNTVLWTYNHNYKSDISIPYGGEDILKKIIIGDNCWFGFGSIILPGAEIGEGCIIGAGSVVSGKYGNNLLIAGNPAKILRKLDEASYERLKKKDKLYLKMKHIGD